MKIAYLCSGDLTKARGYTVHTFETVKNLERLGLDIRIFAPLPKKNSATDLKIRYIPAINFPILRPLSFRIALSIVLLYELLTRSVDIIYVREIPLSLGPHILGRIFKKPVVIEINNIAIDFFSTKAFRVFLVFIFYSRKISFKLAHKIIVANDETKRLLSDEYDASPDKFVVIPMGANTELFRPMDKNECRHLVGLDIKYRYVGFIGTLYHFQALECLVQAAPLVLKKKRDARFLIVGSGAEGDKLKGLVREKGLSESFIFEDEKEYDVIPYYINSCDVCISLVTPERSKTFSFPLKVYEYLACGRPVVIGNLKNESELLNRNATPVINPSDPIALSEAILNTMGCIDRLKAECDELRNLIVEKYSWERSAKRTLGVLKKMAY